MPTLFNGDVLNRGRSESGLKLVTPSDGGKVELKVEKIFVV